MPKGRLRRSETHYKSASGNSNIRGTEFRKFVSRVLAPISEKLSRQSGICHCGILARLRSHSESRLPLDLCRRAELKTDDIIQLRAKR